MIRSTIIIILLSVILLNCTDEIAETENLASKPLFRDPIHDGAADPVVIWNKNENKWFMFYTNRRANVEDLDGVTWVHGTRIGIAESLDGGASWQYRDTCDIPSPYNETHWAPEVIEHKGEYHMYLSYVPGIFDNWNHQRQIIHLTSKNLIKWNYESTLELACDKVIDACVIQLPTGGWRMWYNNEKDGKSIYFADSDDLYNWKDMGKAVNDQMGEGPKVFRWKDKNWMVTDVWQGLAIYESKDFTSWNRISGNLLADPGTGQDDNVIGRHPDVVINDGRAYLFYFTHPGQIDSIPNDNLYEKRRSSIQVVELKYENDHISCDRNKPTYINLTAPREHLNK